MLTCDKEMTHHTKTAVTAQHLPGDNLGIVGIKGRAEKHPAKFHIPAWLGWILTFGFFNLSLFFFRSESMAGAIQMFRNLGAMNYTGKMFEVASSVPMHWYSLSVSTLLRPGSGL